MSLLDFLPHVTTRIEAVKPNGETSIGTGFFFGFSVPGKGEMVTVLTNKHVVEGATKATIFVSRANGDQPAYGTFNSWTISDFDKIVVGHPTPEVDLAAFPVGAVLNQMAAAGTPPFIKGFALVNIPAEKDIAALTAVEDILMIGYPTGIWDKTNNLPVIRRGITATPYARDYEGRPEFMIDAACFPGSSGSPVVIANQGSWADKDGGISMGTRFYLLGLLWGGPQYTAEGKIIPKPAPTAIVPVSVSQIPTNLGYCVKSRMIRDLEPILLAKFG